jgi:DNA-binding NtrC family response regulator
MRPVRIEVIGIGDGALAASELSDLLAAQDWCKVGLHLLSEEAIREREFPSASFFIFVHRDPIFLARFISHFRLKHQNALYFFVNLFRQPTSCLDILVAGFDNFISYPFQAVDIAARVQTSLGKRDSPKDSEAEVVTNRLTLEIGLRDLIGTSRPFNRVLNEIAVLARVDASVLVTGETGTGKDICARAIHYLSSRSTKPFIPVNSGAIPEELFENELFGHERGAYTDARHRHPGLIQEAAGGTIFLDDIESLSLNNQAKLLRFLQGNEYTPLGSGKPVKAEVRIIAATNADLLQRVRERTFREDMYFRLEVLTLSLPPLRERVEDIPLLAHYFASRYCSAYGKPEVSFSCSAIEKLSAYSWPGNVRQLENVLHRAIVHSTNSILSSSDIVCTTEERTNAIIEESTLVPFKQARAEVVTRFEREYVSHVLRLCNGNITRAAKCAGKNRRAFWEIMRKHSLLGPG